jgi:transposase
MTGDMVVADSAVASMNDLAARRDATLWKILGSFWEGKLLVERREFARGSALLQKALDKCDQTGWRICNAEFPGVLAQGLAGLGQLDTSSCPVFVEPHRLSTEAFQMAKTRPPYSPEFRRQMVDLVRAGGDPAELAREFEPTAQSISHWVAQADRQEGRREEKGGGLTAAERDELARLRRENKQLRLERDILSRAAAWFARETGTIPSGSSSS